MRWYGCAAALGLAALGWTAQDLRPSLSALAIVGARIEVSPGEIVEDGTVVTQDGRITAVGKGVAVPAGAEVIDGKGLYVFAGFIDAGTSKGMKAAPARPRQSDPFDQSYGFLTGMPEGSDLIHPEVVASELYDPDSPDWAQARSAGFTTALVVPTGGVFSGQASLMNLSGRPARNSCIDQVVAVALSSGTLPGTYPGTRLGALATARQAFMDADWVKARQSAYESGDGPRGPFDRSLLFLGAFRARKAKFLIAADPAWEIESWRHFSKEYDLKPLLWGVKGGHRVAADLAGSQVVLRVDFDKEPKVEGTPTKADTEQKRVWQEGADNAKALNLRGVKFAFSSAGCKDTAQFWESVRTMVKLGLPRNVALSALTTEAAEILGVSKRFGKIAPGMTANLTILSADFTDANAKTKLLVVDGIKIDPSKTPFKFSNQIQRGDGE